MVVAMWELQIKMILKSTLRTQHRFLTRIRQVAVNSLQSLNVSYCAANSHPENASTKNQNATSPPPEQDGRGPRVKACMIYKLPMAIQ